MMSFVFMVVLFGGKVIHHGNENLCKYSNVVYLLIGLVILSISIIIYRFCFMKKVEALSRKTCLNVLFLGELLFFVLQLLVFRSIYFHSDWDCGTMDYVSGVIAAGGQFQLADFFVDYYSRFPNNMFLLGILSMIKSLALKLGVSDIYIPTVAASLLCMDISVILGTLSAKRILKNRHMTVFVYILLQLLVGWNPWGFIPYTDTGSVLFSSLTLYLYLSRQDASSMYYRWFLIGLSGMVGYYMKPSSVIVLIAIIIVELISLKRDKCKQGAKILLCLIGAGILAVVLQLCVRQYVGIETDSEKEFNMMYFVMLGLGENATGAYDPVELDYATSFETAAERKQGIHDRIVEKLDDKGIGGLLSFEVKKMLLNYDDGSFFWGREGEFFLESEDKVLSEGILSKWLRWFYYMEDNTLLPTVMQTVWIVVLGLTMAAAWMLRKQLSKEKMILCLSIIGITLFTLLFEGRSRYLLTYVSYFAIVAGVGLQEVFQKYMK